ncbi:MAG TPA: transaldolase, partial [Phycisphaerales bacterium]|nr:transaldolase [Phycisphaerales bacterium]
AYSDVLYVEALIGPDTVNTMPPQTITAFLEHGQADLTLEQDTGEAEEVIRSLERAGISMEGVAAKLLADGVKSFADSFDKLLANIEEKKALLLPIEHMERDISLGTQIPSVEATLADLQRRDVMDRIQRKDHTVWKPDPTEISNRLGWLNTTDLMSEQVPMLEAFAQEIRDAGYRHVVLLGMGGSSLGPEVLRQAFGSKSRYPELIVLDSTVPARVQAVTETIDPTRTLFVVSSKSGRTIETLSLYQHFNRMVEQRLGVEASGKSFAAITDSGTFLAKLARDRRFRRVFVNPSDIGGRYSVLSYFGLVPAVLAGIDIVELLDRADCMRKGCPPYAVAHNSPAAWLGAVMGTLASTGRDKLTLVTSPTIGSLELWVEQLLAESTGKEGKGIMPVAGEPLAAPANYDDDRLFVYLRLEDDDNEDADTAMNSIEASGQPVVRLKLGDRYDLGGEFFRWELATTVAGALLGI